MKKPYASPKLIAYGNLTELTRGTGMMGMMDNMMVGSPRTG